MLTAGSTPTSQKRLIGILGGLGPRAHILFEEHLLAKAVVILGAVKDADFPAWVLASFPQTPDRTRALCGAGEQPLPYLKKSLADLAAAGADFALIACVTSHALLAREKLPLPVLSLPAVTASAAMTYGVKRAGILATTGTLRAGLFKKAFADAGVDSLSPFDLPDGDAIQQNLVMTAIYGPGGGSAGAVAGGIKGDGPTRETADLLLAAGKSLVAAGADALVIGCTEISFVSRILAETGVRLVDPLEIAAEAAIRYAYGLPFTGTCEKEVDALWEKCFL
jgi:aspartate racemase